MLDRVLRTILILATLHLHAPLCRLHASCFVPHVAENTSAPVEAECECCKKKHVEPCQDKDTEQPESNSGDQKPRSCHCLCGLVSMGYIPLTPVLQVGLVQDASAQLNVSNCCNTQDGFEQAIDRPPRS